jgi:hypothetical protein
MSNAAKARFKVATAREAWCCNDCRAIVRPGAKIMLGYGLALCSTCARRAVVRDVQRIKRNQHIKRKRAWRN